MSDQIKVLVVDDSPLVRKVVTDFLESDPKITVVGTANNGKTAIYRNNELNPDVITMDIEMPVLDGLSALDTIIKTNPKPVIMMSVLTQHGAEATFKALDLGAVDFIPKPSTSLALNLDDIAELLITKVKNVYEANIKISSRKARAEKKEGKFSGDKLKSYAGEFDNSSRSDRIVGIGTSTGGPSALTDVFSGLPEHFPSSILVVQHMPEGFTKAFSTRLNNCSNVYVKEAEHNEPVMPGCAYVAPGNSHLIIEKYGGSYMIKLNSGKKKSGHRPSIDILFDSMAEHVGKNSVAVIMTGMGKDGADGIVNIKNRGGYTIAQDEESSVVYGMNRVAVVKGGIFKTVPLDDISKEIIDKI